MKYYICENCRYYEPGDGRCAFHDIFVKNCHICHEWAEVRSKNQNDRLNPVQNSTVINQGD